MRIDPERVYVEIEPGALAVNPQTGETRRTKALIVHWKAGRKWKAANFLADDGEGFESLCGKLGAYLDNKGMAALLDEVFGTADRPAL